MSVDLSVVWASVQRMFAQALALLPRLVIGALVLYAFMLVGRVVGRLAHRSTMRWRRDRDLAEALGRIAHIGVVVLGVLVAMAVTFPSFSPADLVGVLGIGSVAIGFAFKDIFQNFLAGILLLITRPFRVGDQIRVG